MATYDYIGEKSGTVNVIVDHPEIPNLMSLLTNVPVADVAPKMLFCEVGGSYDLQPEQFPVDPQTGERMVDPLLVLRVEA